jgi:hypothetical protein
MVSCRADGKNVGTVGVPGSYRTANDHTSPGLEAQSREAACRSHREGIAKDEEKVRTLWRGDGALEMALREALPEGDDGVHCGAGAAVRAASVRDVLPARVTGDADGPGGSQAVAALHTDRREGVAIELGDEVGREATPLVEVIDSGCDDVRHMASRRECGDGGVGGRRLQTAHRCPRFRARVGRAGGPRKHHHAPGPLEPLRALPGVTIDHIGVVLVPVEIAWLGVGESGRSGDGRVVIIGWTDRIWSAARVRLDWRYVCPARQEFGTVGGVEAAVVPRGADRLRAVRLSPGRSGPCWFTIPWVLRLFSTQLRLELRVLSISWATVGESMAGGFTGFNLQIRVDPDSKAQPRYDVGLPVGRDRHAQFTTCVFESLGWQGVESALLREGAEHLQ